MSDQHSIEDVRACVEAGRLPRDHGPYLIHLGDAELNFRTARIEEPVLTGRQILVAAGVPPDDGHRAFRVSPGGTLDALPLDETTDLRTGSIKHFLVFEGAGSFSFELDNRTLSWGQPEITGKVLKCLAQVDPSAYRVWCERPGQPDLPVEDNETVRLDGDGSKRFFSGKCQSTAGSSNRLLPAEDRRYLANRNLTYDEVMDSGSSGVIIRGFALPEGKFQVTAADVLVLLPSGYPDVPPDMFYTEPWLRLAQGNCYPARADQPHSFAGVRWQRWSRHNHEWRPGIDGLRTMIKRIETAIEDAA